MKKKKKAVIEPLFNFLLSNTVTFPQISKQTILIKQKNEILSAVTLLDSEVAAHRNTTEPVQYF